MHRFTAYGLAIYLCFLFRILSISFSISLYNFGPCVYLIHINAICIWFGFTVDYFNTKFKHLAMTNKYTFAHLYASYNSQRTFSRRNFLANIKRNDTHTKNRSIMIEIDKEKRERLELFLLLARVTSKQVIFGTFSCK